MINTIVTQLESFKADVQAVIDHVSAGVNTLNEDQQEQAAAMIEALNDKLDEVQSECYHALGYRIKVEPLAPLAGPQGLGDFVAKEIAAQQSSAAAPSAADLDAHAAEQDAADATKSTETESAADETKAADPETTDATSATESDSQQ